MTATVIYSPLPFTPKFTSENPYVLVRLGATFKTKFQLREEFELDHSVLVVVTGFYKNDILAFPQMSEIYYELQREFFKKHSPEQYRELSQDEYNNLYPDEFKSLPLDAYSYGLRVVPEFRSFLPEVYF